MITLQQLTEEFDKKFPRCDCRNGLPPHFDDPKVNRNEVLTSLALAYRAGAEAMREAMQMPDIEWSDQGYDHARTQANQQAETFLKTLE